ncbi:MAG: Gfo/Idh/MocA family protein [Phycisphaeraceae bacterium]
MSKLRFGILSTGNIARQFASGVVGGSDRVEVAAVASRSAGSAKQFADAHGVPKHHAGYDALLADPGIDAVYNALPNSLHAEWTLKALGAGKHVLCEKPLAMDEAQAREMFDGAKRASRLIAEAFMYRCHPQTRAVVQAIRDGAIGEVKLIRTSFCYRTKKIDGNVRFDKQLGGGALMDIGCYCVDFTRLIVGEDPTSIQAVGRLHPSGVDVAASGVLAYPSGVAATFSCGMDTQASNLAQVCGTEGYIEVPVPWKPTPGSARWRLRKMTPPKQDGDKQPADPMDETIQSETDTPLYALESDAFAQAVLDGAEPFMPEADSLSNAAVLDELRRQVGVVW